IGWMLKWSEPSSHRTTVVNKHPPSMTSERPPGPNRSPSQPAKSTDTPPNSGNSALWLAVWALDEPTVSLDAASTGLFADAVRRHLGSGGSALIATHIDLGLDADLLDLTPYRAAAPGQGAAVPGDDFARADGEAFA
ncbi:hypothetical protein LCGC14_2033070, partial [marine sediment metagenome]